MPRKSILASFQSGTWDNWGQSPLGECVFKQLSPIVGVYKLAHTHTHTQESGSLPETQKLTQVSWACHPHDDDDDDDDDGDDDSAAGLFI